MAQRFLSNIKVNDAYTLPASDGTDGQVISTDGAGTLTFADAAASDAIEITVKNVSGGSLSIGTVVHPSPSANPPGGNVIEVIAADNSSASTMPAIGVLKATLADDAEGGAIAFGQVSGFDTSSFTAGDSIYVNTSGGFTATKPTGTALIQKIGIVVKSHASNGSIKVFGANRTNDVPNIAEDYLWLGNSSGVATATEHLLNNVKDVTTSSPTDGQVLTWDNANSYWKNADASGGSGGSDTGTVTIERDVFDGSHATDPTDGNNTTFTISSVISGENNVQVYIDGVYQSKDNYTTASDVVTFDPAPPANSELEIIHVKAITGQVTLDKFDGDNSTTAFTLSKSIDNENNLQVYVNGVYQSKDNFSTSGSVLTFTTAPANNAKIEVVHIKAVDVTAVSADLFTGNGTQTAFDLTATPSGSGKTLVFVQGVYQEKSTYNISGNTLTFTTAPPDGYTIEVTTFGRLAVSENTVNVERFTGDSSTTDFSLSNSPSANNLDVYVSGLYQNKNSYTYSAGTISLSPAPDTGVIVEAKYIANITQVVAADNDFAKFRWDSTAKTAAFTAVANRGYFVDTSSAAITITLPSSPSVGDEVTIVDYGDNSSTNNITLTSSDDILDSSSDRIISTNSVALSLVYSGSTKGWLNSKDSSADLLAVPSIFNVDFLVVAGGGGSGRVDYYGGGGGAGGFRTSISADGNGGGQTADSAVSVTTGASNTYTVTVGEGGAGEPVNNSSGTNGEDTVFATITSKGGGGGGGTDVNGLDGGSGGGAYGWSNARSGGAALTSPVVHGYAGASTTAGGDLGGAGGGGAGSVGQWVSSLNGGTGGAPLDSTITGSSVYYAGGGGGARGWTGSYGTDHANSRAVDNSGDGGTPNVSSGNGYSGIVILKYPDTYTLNKAAGHTTSELNVASGSGYKRTTFTSGTGTIYFTK